MYVSNEKNTFLIFLEEANLISDNLDTPYTLIDIDVFAITSETETQSIVLMEAMATGLPAVAVKAGAIGELVISGKNGFLCAPGDVPGIANSLIELLQSEDLRRHCGQGSLEIIARHDITHTLRRFEEIYGMVMEAGRR